MRDTLLNFLYFGVGGGVVATVFVFLGPGVSYGSHGTDVADGVVSFAIVFAAFAWPVVLNADWWLSVGLLGLAFYLAHRRAVPPST